MHLRGETNNSIHMRPITNMYGRFSGWFVRPQRILLYKSIKMVPFVVVTIFLVEPWVMGGLVAGPTNTGTATRH